ncbi:MAG TPA: alpha/beta hydrolase [Terriglobia bacterium]|nr:alpha/beta hydrolase [Terriglobia bacterium]
MTSSHSLRSTFAVLVFAALVAAQASQPAAAREGYAELPGVRIWYKDTGGRGIPVVFMHAATGSSRVWEYQIPPFTGAGYRFIAYDRRGWGRTVIERTGPQPGTAADDLQGLMDYLHIDRFHLVATAAGVSVSLDYAVSFPQRLRSLVISDGAMGGLQDEAYQELYRRIRSPQLDALPPELRELGPSYRAANPEGTRRWIELERMSRPDGPAAPPQATRNRLTFSLLETMKVPMLLITGDADLSAPPPLLRLFTSRIRNTESLIIPEAGHSAYWEQPEIFNRTVLEFIRKH